MMQRIARAWATTLVLASLSLGAAGLPAAAAETGATTACPVGWGSFAKTRSFHTTSPLTNARTARHNCFDRTVIDIPGASSGSLGYSVKYVDRLRADGSGDLIPVSGGAIIEIVVHAAAYDTSTGKPTYAAKPGNRLPGVNVKGYRTLRDAKYGGSFEGQTQFGLGIRARLPFRVLALDGRIVVDVAHNWTGDWTSLR